MTSTQDERCTLEVSDGKRNKLYEVEVGMLESKDLKLS